MPDLNLYLQHNIRDLNCNKCLKEIEDICGFKVHIHTLNSSFWECYRAEREQFDASCILERFYKSPENGKTMIVTDVDLFLPIFTFVFGLAQLGGNTGIVSIFRLDNKYYGLPYDEESLKSRMKKEIIHEFGHLIGMRHCHDHRCVMSSANNIDDLDVRPVNFCPSCNSILDPMRK